MAIQCDTQILSILDRAQQGKAPSREECVQLLDLADNSLEAAMMRGVADSIARQRFHAPMLQGQIGIEFKPCSADCQFCSFAESFTQFDPFKMAPEKLREHTKAFAESGKPLTALFLMMPHEFDYEFLLDAVRDVRKIINPECRLVVNIGDFTETQAKELKETGVTGAYHVLRLQEGVCTKISREERIATIENVKNSGLDWYYCCEPIGPEHSSEEIADQILLGREYECYQHAAMRRVNFGHSPLKANGSISELRMANVVAVIALAMIENPEITSIAVHEPSGAGLLAGANTLYAESGGNPRDTKEETSKGRGHTMQSCAKMLEEAGWSF